MNTTDFIYVPKWKADFLAYIGNYPHFWQLEAKNIAQVSCVLLSSIPDKLYHLRNSEQISFSLLWQYKNARQILAKLGRKLLIVIITKLKVNKLANSNCNQKKAMDVDHFDIMATMPVDHMIPCSNHTSLKSQDSQASMHKKPLTASQNYDEW